MFEVVNLLSALVCVVVIAPGVWMVYLTTDVLRVAKHLGCFDSVSGWGCCYPL